MRSCTWSAAGAALLLLCRGVAAFMGMEDQSLPPGMMNTMRDERGIMDFMGTKTPYESHGDPLSLPTLPDQCFLMHVNTVVRHGSRHVLRQNSTRRLRTVLSAAGKQGHLTQLGESLLEQIDTMISEDERLAGQLSENAFTEAARTFDAMWEPFMVDFTEALGEGRKVVLESTDTPRTTGYADMLQHGLSQTMGVHGVIASELGDDVSSVFASLPPTPIPSEVTDPSTVHPRAAVLRGPKVCPAAQAAKHEALEAAKAVITPYERPTPLTNFERRQLAQRYERAGRGAVPALRVQSDGAVAEDEPLAGIPTTREQAFVEDLVDPQFIHELPSVLESSPYFTAGSPIESALATVARDAFHACRQDGSGHNYANGFCKAWRHHLHLAEKFDFMEDYLSLHKKGVDTNITQAASCGLMEDMFAAADAAVHPHARPDTPGWAESKRRGMHKAGVNPWLAESKHDWSGHASAMRGHPQRGPFMNVRVTHAGTMVPLLGALGLEVGEPYIMGMREHFHVYSREPIPPGAPPVDFNWNRLLALGYGLLEPAAKGGV
ncbi:unnamed protein product, partial [Symbiodinium sp. KB8]